MKIEKLSGDRFRVTDGEESIILSGEALARYQAILAAEVAEKKRRRRRKNEKD